MVTNLSLSRHITLINYHSYYILNRVRNKLHFSNQGSPTAGQILIAQILSYFTCFNQSQSNSTQGITQGIINYHSYYILNRVRNKLHFSNQGSPTAGQILIAQILSYFTCFNQSQSNSTQGITQGITK